MALETADLKPRIGSRVFTDKETLLSGNCAAELRELLGLRGVLLFRGLTWDDAEQFAFASTLGKVLEQGEKGMLKISMDREISGYAEFFPGTFFWHMDGTYENVPPWATITRPHMLAPSGGNTEFTNNYAAYEDLPEEEKARLDRLKVIHSLETSMRPAYPDFTEEQLKLWESYPVRVHPLVWQHRSGRKSLVLSTSASQVIDMNKPESDTLLKRLMDWATQPQYVYSHEWQLDDLLIWDNTGTMHRARPFDPDSGRELHRFTLVGEEPITAASA